MFVDPAMLSAGATHSDSAATHARAGVAALDTTVLGAGIFGGFGAADLYHRTLSTRHGEHVRTLTDQHRTLAGVADKAHRARQAFLDMDADNAVELRAARCNSGI